MTKDMLVQYSI